ncbi:MAG: glycine--tRNA ligase subunit beta, partial [Coriobacteriales bacterium]|nr:glycine--tRNA ligase subunit beta [Coriobacteriales bacterium]
IVVHNGDPACSEQIVRGHERVIRARLADAAFFYHEDLSHPLEAYVDRLCSITFQEKLGTLFDKAERIERLAGRLGETLGAPADEIAFAQRAAHLAKADLVTSAVVEFTSLQGVMGGYYATAAGEEPEVATAIVEHYQPRFAGDALPSTTAARLVAVADKMDTIVGIFAAGMAPTGSADPFALRRQSIGVLQMMLDGTRLSLDETIAAALEGYAAIAGLQPAEEAGAEVKQFMVGRLEGILRERGMAYDSVEAVLAVAADDPADALARSEALQRARDEKHDEFEDLSIAFSRAKNLGQPALGTAYDTATMGEHELALAETLDAGAAELETEMSQHAYSAVLETFAGMREPIDAFFDNVLVMDEDAALRENRLKLLNRFVEQFEQFADFSRLEG